MPQLDKETQKELTEGERIANFVKGDDWPWLKGLLLEKIMDIQSVLNIETEDPAKLIIDLQSRKNVVSILTELIKEVEGRAAQGKANSELMNPGTKDDIVQFHE